MEINEEAIIVESGLEQLGGSNAHPDNLVAWYIFYVDNRKHMNNY